MPVAISEHSGRSEVGDGAGMEREGARRGSVERQLAGAVWGRGETKERIRNVLEQYEQLRSVLGERGWGHFSKVRTLGAAIHRAEDLLEEVEQVERTCVASTLLP